jgi:hypothetical protein
MPYLSFNRPSGSTADENRFKRGIEQSGVLFSAQQKSLQTFPLLSNNSSNFDSKIKISFGNQSRSLATVTNSHLQLCTVR